jgi:hypothetical protein
MRLVPVATLVAFIIVMSACGEEKANLTFVNSTATPLCFGVTRVDPELCSEIKPHSTAKWKHDCYGSMKVVLARPNDARALYARDATCDEWQQSGGTFIIKQRGQELVVTDSLPEGND